jgi:hypothetical protein
VISVFIDMSVFVGSDSFGRISGSISFPVAPQVGDLICLNHTGIPAHILKDIAALPLLNVEARTITPTREKEIALSLCDLVLGCPAEALKAMHGLERAHGLIGERYHR